jgi:hypothetical protein
MGYLDPNDPNGYHLFDTTLFGSIGNNAIPLNEGGPDLEFIWHSNTVSDAEHNLTGHVWRSYFDSPDRPTVTEGGISAVSIGGSYTLRLPPVVDPIPDQQVSEGAAVSFTASSQYDPGLTPTYSLAAGAPAGAAIDPKTGVFTWTPTAPGTFNITVLVTDNGTPPLSNSQTFSVVVNPAQQTPTITWNPPSPITYGTPLGAAQLDATATVDGVAVSGTFTYSPPAGTVLHAGLGQPLSVTFTPDDTADFTTATGSATIDVLKATPTISVVGVHVTYDGNPHPATATITGVNGDNLSSALVITTYNGSSAVPVDAGAYAVTASFPGNGDYNAVTDTSQQVLIDQATPVFSGLSGPTIIIGTPSTPLAGTLKLGSLVPTGSVSITFNGVTQNPAIVAGGNLSATFATASLPAGSYTITYSYAGDVNFKPVGASTTLAVTYNVNPEFDQTKAHQRGSTIPIQLQLTDANGNNVGSASTPITALYILDQNGNQVPLMDSGNSNPGDLFRFDPTTGTYIFNLKTTGYASGRYTLYFRTGNDPVLHSVSFVIR